MSDEQRMDISSACFQASFDHGFLTAIQPGAAIGGPRDSAYVLKGHTMGGVTLTIAQGEAMQQYQLLQKDATAPWTMVEGSATHLVSRAEGEKLPVTVTQDWRLQGELLHMTLTLRNTSDKPLCVEDLALQFDADSTFNWGCNAAAKVIGHHGLAGHNSHLFFERCDGQGPMLMVLPDEKTHLEYFVQTSQEKGSLMAYIHSAKVREDAVAAGAHVHLPATTLTLAPGEEQSYSFRFVWAADRPQARELLVKYGLMDVQVLPGMTVPEKTDVLLALRGDWADLRVELPENCEQLGVTERQGYRIYRLRFGKLGENTVWLRSGERYADLEFFVTEAPETLIAKRGAFIAAHQVKDESRWYDGLLSEWNNETAVQLGPDNYDTIGGWRIYEVTCDDPGLSKPAFLSSKLVEAPNVEEAAALDRYVERFVWGGLQCTEQEPYPYGIYGIPDWHVLRNSKDEDVRGKLHIWRIYDYPHIALMYYNLYRMRRLYPALPLSQSAETYLIRAARTLIAMFTIPLELDDWSAFGTGLYNELAAEDILKALEKESMPDLRLRLERLWNRKAYKFAARGADVFGSEYPFDTTGFESTHALAKRALKLAKPGKRMEDREISPAAAASFMETQMRCNVSCRGEMEMDYWWYGSDYRGDNLHYALSYMSQMGGWAIMDYALYHAENPFPLLRLGYGSLLSSWALLNSGREETNWGWRFPGKEHDGAASGGFEPLYLGKTWLDQPHHGGAWYYSCEIDLGFCGYMRGAATIYAVDPLFGPVCLGGTAAAGESGVSVLCQDGVNRRFHVVQENARLHLTCDCGHFDRVEIDAKAKKLRVHLKLDGVTGPAVVALEEVSDPWQESEHLTSQTQTCETSGVYTFPLVNMYDVKE